MSTPNDTKLDTDSLRQGIEQRFPVSLRGKTYHLRPLAIIEEDRIRREILSEMNEMEPHERNSISESIRESCKKLETASTSDVNVNDPQLPVGTTERWTPVEIDRVFKAWLVGCEKANPAPDKLTAEELGHAVEVLKKSTQSAERILTELSFYQLVDICHHLLIKVESLEAKLPG